MTLRLKASRKFPSVPAVKQDVMNHTEVLLALKEAAEIGQRRTGDVLSSYIRVQDLIDLGLITFEGNTTAIVGADLSEIADIGDLSAAAIGDFLRYDGTQWVNDQLSNADVAGLNINWSQLVSIPALVDDLAGLTDPNADRLVFWDDSAGSLAFLTAGTGLSITGTTIESTGGTGEANTASNQGGGEELFIGKTGVDLEFRTLVAGTNVTLTTVGDTVEIAAAGGGGGTGGFHVVVDTVIDAQEWGIEPIAAGAWYQLDYVP